MSTRIELLDDYFVEIDNMNHTLKKHCIGKSKKTGEITEYDTEISYHPNLSSCVKKMAELLVLNSTDGKILTIGRYAEQVDNVYERILATQFKVVEK